MHGFYIVQERSMGLEEPDTGCHDVDQDGTIDRKRYKSNLRHPRVEKSSLFHMYQTKRTESTLFRNKPRVLSPLCSVTNQGY